MIQRPRFYFWFLVRRLLGYIILIVALGSFVWLFAFLRDIY